jgi:hypothetical protein
MAANAGPDIAEDGIVFYYDTGNTVKSYIGEPTTNQFTNPDFSSGTTGWTFGSWDGGRYTYTTETVLGPFGKPVPALKVVRTTSDTSYAHFHQGNGGKFTNGNTYTLSAYVKGAGTLAQYTQGGYSPITYIPGQFVTLTDEWQRISYTLSSQTDTLYPYWAAENITQNVPMYFTFAQSEQKNHRTQFTNGSRLGTQGLLDLSNTSTLNITNATFDNNAQIEFDGTNDYTNSGYDLSWNNASSASIELMVKPYTVSGGNYGIIGKEYPNWEWAFYQYNSLLALVYWDTGGSHSNGMDFSVNAFPTANVWYHLVYTWDGSTSIFYINGTALGSKTATNPAANQNRSNNVMIGGHTYVWADSYFNGKLDLVKFYNRNLTASEVLTNYNALKTRFGI